MNRFVPIFLVAIAVFVFGNSQLGFAQIQILDGNGKQVTPNEIPAEKVEEPLNQVPKLAPQMFGGNGSRIIIRKSFSKVDENGEMKTESSGKAIVIGPDGKRQEFDLKDGENIPLNFGGMRIDGLVPNRDANGQKSAFSLGLQCKPIPPAVASQLKMETGLMVSQVPQGSPAATAGVKQFDVLLFADEKQLIRKSDLQQAVQAAGEADSGVLLTLIRGGKEMAITVKPEKQVARQANPGQMNPLFKLDIPGFEDDGLFAEDALGNGIEARMRQRMEAMQERFRRIERQLENGAIEIE